MSPPTDRPDPDRADPADVERIRWAQTRVEEAMALVQASCARLGLPARLEVDAGAAFVLANIAATLELAANLGGGIDEATGDEDGDPDSPLLP